MEGVVETVRESVVRRRHQWMNIAFDIALSQVSNATGKGITPEEICDTYKLTQEQVIELFELPEFVTLVKDARRRVSSMGDNAAVQLHAQILASDMQVRIYQEILKGHVDIKDQMRFYEKLMQYGMLDPATNGTNKQKEGDGAGVTIVNMHLPDGVGRLKHVYDASSGEIVDAN